MASPTDCLLHHLMARWPIPIALFLNLYILPDIHIGHVSRTYNVRRVLLIEDVFVRTDLDIPYHFNLVTDPGFRNRTNVLKLIRQLHILILSSGMEIFLVRRFTENKRKALACIDMSHDK